MKRLALCIVCLGNPIGRPPEGRSDDGRRMITDAAGLEKGDRIRLSMRDGDIAATVDEVLRKDNG